MKCVRFQGKVVTTEEWYAKHGGHGGVERKKAAQQPARGYVLYELCCKCGAKHLVSEDRRSDG